MANLYTQAFIDLKNFFAEQGNCDDPDSKVEEVKQALINAMPPNPTNGFTIICVETNDEMLGVQQFVTQFGFHLEYRVSYASNRHIFDIVPNWK